MNVFIKEAASIVPKAGAATATAITQTIDPVSGYKIGVNAIYFENATGATTLFLLGSKGRTTEATTAASGASTIILTSKSIGRATSTDAVSDIATGDYICIKLDNGTYQFVTIASMQTSVTVTLSTAILDDVTAGQEIWGFGVATDTGQCGLFMTSSESVQRNQDVPFLWANNRGDPAVLYYLQTGSTLAYANLKGGAVVYAKA